MRVRRLPHHDVLDAEDGTVVLHGEQASLLTAISAAIWYSLTDPDWVELETLSAHLAETFGPPPTEHAVPNLLAELSDAGLVELEP